MNLYGLNERIKILRESLEMERSEFCEILENGMTTDTLQNIELKRQRAYSWIIERIGETHPEYEYWLATGKEIPECGQISPITNEAQKKRA